MSPGQARGLSARGLSARGLSARGRVVAATPTRGTVNRWMMPVLAAVLLFGTIGVAQVSGNWVTSGRTATSGQAAGSGAGTGAGGDAEKGAVAAGSLIPADLKGWMTVQEAADGLGMPLADLLGLIAAPQGSAVTGATAFKDLEKLVPGFSLTTFRETVTAG